MICWCSSSVVRHTLYSARHITKFSLHLFVGVMRGTEFNSYTNFSIEVISAVTSENVTPALSGFIFSVQSTDGAESM